jgi:hypothetical protein
MSTGKSVKLLGSLRHQHVSGRPFCQAVRAVRGFRVFLFSKVMWALRKKLNAWKHVRIRHCSTWPGRKLPKCRRLLPAHRTVLYSCFLAGFQLRFTIKQRSCNATLLTTNVTFNKELVVLCLLQLLVSFISSMTLLSAGMNFGFSAVALPHMQDPAGTDRLTVEEGSWFGAYIPGHDSADWLDKYINNWLVKWHLHAFYLRVFM